MITMQNCICANDLHFRVLIFWRSIMAAEDNMFRILLDKLNEVKPTEEYETK